MARSETKSREDFAASVPATKVSLPPAICSVVGWLPRAKKLARFENAIRILVVRSAKEFESPSG